MFLFCQELTPKVIIMWMNSVSQFRDSTLKKHADEATQHLFEVCEILCVCCVCVSVLLSVFLLVVLSCTLYVSLSYFFVFPSHKLSHSPSLPLLSSFILRPPSVILLSPLILQAFSHANIKCHLTSRPIDTIKLNKGNRVSDTSIFTVYIVLGLPIIVHFYLPWLILIFTSWYDLSQIEFFSTENYFEIIWYLCWYLLYSTVFDCSVRQAWWLAWCSQLKLTPLTLSY